MALFTRTPKGMVLTPEGKTLLVAAKKLALMREDQALELVELGQARLWKGPGMEIPLAIACLEKRKEEKPITTFVRAITQRHPGGRKYRQARE